MAKKDKKKPKFEASNKPAKGKVPVAVETVPSLRNPAWRLNMADKEGSWPLHGMDPGHVLDVLGKLANYETMTWQQLHGPDHHYNYEGICADAKKRLCELRKEQWADHLYSLHLRNLWRLWGLLIDGVFHILWWDPEHAVYVTKPR
jgi:hypothetical protein